MYFYKLNHMLNKDEIGREEFGKRWREDMRESDVIYFNQSI